MLPYPHDTTQAVKSLASRHKPAPGLQNFANGFHFGPNIPG